MTKRAYTSKQMGDAGEMLVAAELTLNGIPAFIVPSNWPGYDVVAQLLDGQLQRISVKTRTYAKSGNFVGWGNEDDFDWLAIVILPGADMLLRRVFIVPKAVAIRRSYVAPQRDGRGFFVNRLVQHPPEAIAENDGAPTGGWGLADFESNFRLNNVGTAA